MRMIRSGRARAVHSRAWSAGSTARSSRRRVTKRRRKVGRRSSSIRTATANATTMLSPVSRLTQPRIKGSTPPFMAWRQARSMGQCGVRSWASPAPSSVSVRARTRLRQHSPKSSSRRCPATRRAAWISTAMASSGLPLQAGELRPAKVQGAVGPHRDGQALSGRLDALSLPRSAVQGCGLIGVCRSELL